MKGANHTLSIILYHAVKAGNVKYAKTLIEQKADVNFHNQNLSTPLHKAASKGYTEIAEFLIKEHANIDTKNIKGQTALYKAAAYNHREVLKLLLENNANPNIQMYDKWTALHASCFWGYDKITKLLLENKASPDILDENRCSPLHFAISRKEANSALILISYGANFLINNNERVSPLDLLTGKDSSSITNISFSSKTKCKLLHKAIQVIDYGQKIENLEQKLSDQLKEILHSFIPPPLINIVLSYLFIMDSDKYSKKSVCQLTDLYLQSVKDNQPKTCAIKQSEIMEQEDQEVKIVAMGVDVE